MSVLSRGLIDKGPFPLWSVVAYRARVRACKRVWRAGAGLIWV